MEMGLIIVKKKTEIFMVLKIGFRFFMRDIIPFSYDFKMKYYLIQEEKAIDQKRRYLHHSQEQSQC